MNGHGDAVPEIAIAAETCVAQGELAACDFTFDVVEEATGPFDGDDIVNVVPVAPYRKAYECTGDLAPEEGEILFVARVAGRACGYAVVARAWNDFAQIEDIAVDRQVRRLGVGARLLDAAVAWARAQALPGLRLETQSNNVPACRFYARYGFRLGGHDRHLYGALGLPRQETALFWYLFPDQDR